MTRRPDLLRDEDGFSLMELLAAMVIGSVILVALMFVFITGLKGTAKIGDRVEATAKGRIAMDRVTTLLNAQVCVTDVDEVTQTEVSVAPVLPGSTANSVTFYGDLSGASIAPDRYTITYDPAARRLTEYRFDGTNTQGEVTYPPAATQTRVLASNIFPALNSVGVAQPIFRYFAFTGGAVNMSAPLTVPLTNTGAKSTVRVAAQFTAGPERTRTADTRSSTLNGYGYVSTANPLTSTAC